MRDSMLVVATVVMSVGLALVLWRELAGAAERRRVGPGRDVAEVLTPVIATIALLWWVWINRSG